MTMARPLLTVTVGMLAGLWCSVLAAAETSFQTEVSAEAILFAEPSAAPGEQRFQPSMTITPSYRYDRDFGAEVIDVKLFARLAPERTGRTHVDIRDLAWTRVFGDFETKIGISRENWGVMESVQLVDVINQVDDVESLDNKARLGQPMARLSWAPDWGTVTGWVLPYFRRRNFARPASRAFSGGADVDRDHARFHSPAEELYPDLAFRYAHTFGDADIGLGLFRGTDRSPDLIFDLGSGRLVPFYDRLTQLSFDGQWTGDALLLKAEALYRDKARGGQSAALVAGFEYTFFDLGGTGHDLGVIAELIHDGAGKGQTSFDRDLFSGIRYTFNDLGGGEILAGGFVDLVDGTTVLRAKYQQRIGNDWKVELISQAFLNVDRDDLFFARLRDDSFLRINLRYYF